MHYKTVKIMYIKASLALFIVQRANVSFRYDTNRTSGNNHSLKSFGICFIQ